MTRPLRLITELALTALFIVTIALGGLLWRVSTSALHLDDFISDIEATLQDVVPGMSFQINSAILDGGKAEEAFEIVLRDVTIKNATNEKVGSIQAMRLGFSWRNLLLLSLTPSKILIRGPTVQLVRFQDGHIGFNTEYEKRPENKRSLDNLGQFFARAPDAFKEIRIRDAWLQFEDRKDPLKLQATKGEFLLFRSGDEVTGSLTLDIASGKFSETATGSITYDPDAHQTRVALGVRDISMAELSELLPSLPEGVVLKTDVTAVGEIVLDSNFAPLTVTLDMNGDKGDVVYPRYLPQPLALERISLRAAYNVAEQSINLERLQMALADKALISAQGRISDVRDPALDKKIELNAEIKGLPIDALDQAWPQGLAVNARDWVTQNINHGVVDLATLEMNGALKPDKSFTIHNMGGKLAFRDTEVTYMPHMPVATKVKGVANYDAANFNIILTTGDVLQSKLTAADIRISALDQHTQQIDMLLDTNGPLQNVIKIIESQPLEYPQKMGHKSEQFSGNIKTKLYLGFPLLHALKLDEVRMKAAGTITDATIKNVVRDVTATGDRMVVKVDPDSLLLAGRVKLNDAINDVVWREFFNNKNPNATQVDLKGAITPAFLRDLRVPADTYFKGSANGTIRLAQDHAKNISVSAQADAAQAELGIAELGLTKARGVPAKIALDLAIDKDGTATISNASTSWPDVSVNGGMARWGRNGELESATLKNVRMGRTNASFIVTPIASNQTRIVVSGPVVDLSGYWAQKKEPPAKDALSAPRLDINLRSDKLYLDKDMPLTNVRADISVQGPQILAMDISANAEDAKLVAVQKTIGKGLQTLDVTSNNVGKILQALDMTDTVVGGDLSIHGKSTPEKQDLIEGRMWLKKFTLVKAPVLARLINALSPVGLLELLNNNGLNFDSMISDITLQKRGATIKLSDGKLTGSSLGMTFNGYVYRTTGNISLKGTIVPMEGINKFASKIPIIGQILTGLKGEGILAATYSIKGPTSDPTVSVNPLAALAPGILRSILFSGGEDKEE